MIVLKGLPKHRWNILAVQGSPESPNQNKQTKPPLPPNPLTPTNSTDNRYSHHLGKEECWSEEKRKET